MDKLNRLSAAFPITTLRKISDDSLSCAETKVARNIRQNAWYLIVQILQLLCETASKHILALFQTEGWPGDARSTRAAIFASIRLLPTLFYIFLLGSSVEMDRVGGFRRAQSLQLVSARRAQCRRPRHPQVRRGACHKGPRILLTSPPAPSQSTKQRCQIALDHLGQCGTSGVGETRTAGPGIVAVSHFQPDKASRWLVGIHQGLLGFPGSFLFKQGAMIANVAHLT